MALIPLSAHGASPWERLLGHAPVILEQWIALETAFFASESFSPALREQVRRTLAFANGCHYCMAKAGPPDADSGDEKTTLAVAFARRFAAGPSAVSAQDIEILRPVFSDAAIAELLAFIAFLSASQRFGAALGLQPETSSMESPNK